MKAFFKDVGEIKDIMATIRRNVKQIEEKYVQALNSISIDQNSSSILSFIFNDHYLHTFSY